MREGKRPKGLPHLAAIESSFSRTILEVILIPLPCIFFAIVFFFNGRGGNARILLAHRY